MGKSVRNLKIVRSFSNQPVPHLPLTGRWLEQAGFTMGMRVNVLVATGCLVIQPAESLDDAYVHDETRAK